MQPCLVGVELIKFHAVQHYPKWLSILFPGLKNGYMMLRITVLLGVGD